jgi:hypothetical protein
VTVTALRTGCAGDLLDPKVREKFAVAYWPGLDDLPTCQDAVEVNPARVQWLHVDEATDRGISVQFTAAGRTFCDFADWPLVLGEVQL